MKKLLAALSAAGLLSLGITSALGATAATASVRPSTKAKPMAITVNKTTAISSTKNTTFTIKVTHAGANDTLEYGVCNEDASQTNPLDDLGADACQGAQFGAASATGTATLTDVFTPGQQGNNPLSTCPQSQAQYGLGITCIVAVADIVNGMTADATLYFAPAAAKVTGQGANGTITNATITLKSGFEVIGLVGSSPATLTGPCQPFSGTVAGGAAAWTAAPLCDDADNAPAGVGGPYAAGIGFAAGEAVKAYNGATLLAGAQANADSPNPVTNAGGVTIVLPSLPYNTSTGTTYHITLKGTGYPTSPSNASKVKIVVTVKISKTGKAT
jgi:hypothetical protein